MTSTVTYEGDLRTTAQHLQSGNAIETDAPTDNQGKGERFSPTDLIATGLASCMATTMGIKARDMDVDLRGLKVDVTKHMLANPRRIGGIDVHLHFPAGLSLDERQRAILEKTALTCPVMYTLHPDVKVNTEISW
jgi:putative redox protein